MDENSLEIQLGRNELGQAIRSLREQQSLSVRTLAKRAGFSASFISQVENGQASPSIGSMEKIATALGVTLSGFFARGSAEEGTEVVVRAGKGSEIKSEWSSSSIRSLGQVRTGRLFSPMLLSVEPGGRIGSSPSDFRGELFAYVLEGQIQFRLADDVHVLSAGDSIHLSSGNKLFWENHGDIRARILLVSSTN